MLRQLRQALRFAIADFLRVPLAGVLTMLAVIALLVSLVTVRTLYTPANLWRLLLPLAILGVLYGGNRFLRRR